MDNFIKKKKKKTLKNMDNQKLRQITEISSYGNLP